MAKNTNKQESSYESILKESSKQKTKVYGFSKTYPAYIVLVVTIVLSIGAFYLVKQRINSENNRAFDKAVSSVMTRLESKYNEDFQVLRSMRNLYDVYVQVVRDIFELYGSIPIKSYPSILTVMYTPRVEHQNLPEYIHYAKSEGFYEYEIYPEGKRGVYFPVEHIVPLESNWHRSGYDFATDSIVRKAIEKARDSNKIVATHFFKIREPDTLGFYIISPIYERDEEVENLNQRRKYLEGMLMLEIDARTFFRNALGSGNPSDTSIVFKCIDQRENKKNKVVYKSSNADLLETDYHPELTNRKDLNIADRKLKVQFFSVPNFGGTFQKTLPYITLIVSLLISIGFFSFILSVITRKARAMELAESMTRSQRRILDSSKDIIAVLDFDGVWKSMNPACEKIFGYKPDEMIGKNIDILFASDQERNRFKNIIEKTGDEVTERVNILMKSKTNEDKWIDWSFTISRTDNLIYCIGRDITLEKYAEQQAMIRRKQNQLAGLLTREASAFKSFFMIKLSHQIRNSLTSIIGYMQLLSGKAYETEEEHDIFLGEAERSSERLFTFISDIDDVAETMEEGETTDLATIKLSDLINNTKNEISEQTKNNGMISIEMTEESQAPTAVADKSMLSEALTEICFALSTGTKECNIQINTQSNSYESAAEIQILSSPNPLVSEMIETYKNNITNIIEALEFDKEDIIYRFARATANIRMMNGTMKVESFGADEGNIVMITLPMNKIEGNS